MFWRTYKKAKYELAQTWYHRHKNTDRSTNANDCSELFWEINIRRWKTILNIYYAVTKNAATVTGVSDEVASRTLYLSNEVRSTKMKCECVGVWWCLRQAEWKKAKPIYPKCVDLVFPISSPWFPVHFVPALLWHHCAIIILERWQSNRTRALANFRNDFVISTVP